MRRLTCAWTGNRRKLNELYHKSSNRVIWLEQGTVPANRLAGSRTPVKPYTQTYLAGGRGRGQFSRGDRREADGQAHHRTNQKSGQRTGQGTGQGGCPDRFGRDRGLRA